MQNELVISVFHLLSQITPFLGVNPPTDQDVLPIPNSNQASLVALPSLTSTITASVAATLGAYQAFLKQRCHLKKGSWKTSFFFKRLPGRCNVCFRECINSRCYLDKSIILIYMLYVLWFSNHIMHSKNIQYTQITYNIDVFIYTSSNKIKPWLFTCWHLE